MKWWEDSAYDERQPMHFPDRRGGKTVPLPEDTEPEMYRKHTGALALRLKRLPQPTDGHKTLPYPVRRIYV